jgi:hypothetical protein
VLRRILGQTEEVVVVGSWRRLHNEELCNLYDSPNIISMITSRMREAEHVACMGKMRYA